MDTLRQFSRRQLTQIVESHRRAIISLWSIGGFTLLLVPLAEKGLPQEYPLLFILLFAGMVVIASWMYLSLRTQLGYPVYEQALALITCVFFPLITIFWVLRIEQCTDRLLSSYGIKKTKLGLYNGKGIKHLDIQLCDECLYDMRGLDHANVCPECGTSYQIMHIPVTPNQAA